MQTTNIKQVSSNVLTLFLVHIYINIYVHYKLIMACFASLLHLRLEIKCAYIIHGLSPNVQFYCFNIVNMQFV